MRRNRQRPVYRCYYCYIVLVRRKTVDHLIPKSRGGAILGADNRVIACRRCNGEKGARTLEEYRSFLQHRTGQVPIIFPGESEATVGKTYTAIIVRAE